MKRMTCIGAQSIPLTELTARPPSIEMQCRRTGDVYNRTFFAAPPSDAGPTSAMQLPLFEESLARASMIEDI